MIRRRLKFSNVYWFVTIAVIAGCSPPAMNSEENLEKSNEVHLFPKDNAETPRYGSTSKTTLNSGDQIAIYLPFSKKLGTPVAAMLECHGGDWPENLDKQWYGHTMPTFALWSNGTIIWQDNCRYYKGRITPIEVDKLLSSITIHDYNTDNNLRYSYAGRDFSNDCYTMFFVSKGEKQNLILRWPTPNWKTGMISYEYKDESRVTGDVFVVDRNFQPSYPDHLSKEFLHYLRACDSLKSKFTTVIPDHSNSEQLNLKESYTDMGFLYQLQESNPPQWIKIEEKEFSGLKEKQ